MQNITSFHRRHALGALIASALAFLAPPHLEAQSHGPRPAEYRVSAPQTLHNLSVYLIQAPDRAGSGTYLTLKEAMEQKILKIHETGNVGELAVENISSKHHVYIEAGEIVKGGKQDRALGMDAIVPPKSGRLPLESFCVEQGRWSRRGQENAAAFTSSTDQVSSTDLKKAVRYEKNQGKVWNKVSENQSKLSTQAGTDVRDNASATSLQLSLENERVKTSTAEFIRKFEKLPASVQDARGVAFAVNGTIVSADIYASHDLFLKLWPKLLKSAAVEAVAERTAGAAPAPPSSDAVREFIKKGEDAPQTRQQDVNRKTKSLYKESGDTLGNTTKDSSDSSTDGYLHKNYMKK